MTDANRNAEDKASYGFPAPDARNATPQGPRDVFFVGVDKRFEAEGRSVCWTRGNLLVGQLME